MNIIDLLEDNLIENKSVKNLKTHGSVVAFYFAASWCEPCLAFTQLLISFYEDVAIKLDKNKSIRETTSFEVIFISSDLNEDGFKDSTNEMPWPSVSYKHCYLRKKISKKFNVKEIPCLVLVEGWSGQTINTKGRSCLFEDLNGDNFPWRKLALMEVLGTNFMVEGKLRDCGDLLKSAYIAVYFSAHWCPPCRLLTTHLIKVYERLKQEKSQVKFEVVFVSSDRTLASYQEYSSCMPWLLLPFQDHRTQLLTKYFNVQGIPRLILLDASHEIVSANARWAVFNDPTGAYFPWSWEQPEELSESSIHLLHTYPCLILFTEGRAEEIGRAREVLAAPMKKYAEQCRLSQHHMIPLPTMRVFYEGTQSDEVADSVRSFAQIEGREPLVAIIEGHQVLRGGDNELDAACIEALLQKFKEKWLAEDES